MIVIIMTMMKYYFILVYGRPKSATKCITIIKFSLIVRFLLTTRLILQLYNLFLILEIGFIKLLDKLERYLNVLF